MRILFATDGSWGADIAEDYLLSLPLSCADDVTVVTSTTVSERESVALLARCRWRFAARGVPGRTALRHGDASQVAEAVALEEGADLIVVGSRGLGHLTGALLGSVARKLARDALVPLLVVRSRRDAPRIAILAVDGSPEARAAIDLMARMPLPAMSEIVIVRVTTSPDTLHQEELVLEHARTVFGGRIADVAAIGQGHVGEEIVRYALASHADLIVLGTRGQSNGGLVHPSITDHVLSHAHCAVLVGRAPLKTREVRAPAFAASGVA